MRRSLQTALSRNLWFASLALAAVMPAAFASPSDEPSTVASRNLARANGGARIECTTPDGHVLEVVADGDQAKNSPALTLNENTVSCPLPEGQTTLVIKLPKGALLDRFSFVNENAAAAGQLKISVSNDHLSATSPKWVDVDGSTAFTKKRVIDLLMVGVEARYVKLTFNVEKPGRIASLGLYGGEALERLALR